MKFPWANTILLTLLLLQVSSGYLGMLNNLEHRRWLLWLHGLVAYAILLLLFWKGNIIFDTLRRKKVWTRQRFLFLFTLGLLLLTLVLGFIWTLNGPHYFLNISYVSWHIYSAVPLILLMLWHSWKMRFVFRLPAAWERRVFLRGLLLTAGGVSLWQLANRSKMLWHLPGALRRFSGSYERGSDGSGFPVVSWIADNPPPITPTQWSLSIGGAVNTPLTLSYEQIQTRASDKVVATLDCTGGWYTTQTWQGVNLGQLLDEAGLQPQSQSVTVRAVSGYQRRFTLAEVRQYLLAVEVAGTPLSHGHGFPLRLVAWDKRGMEWVKWVTHIEVNRTSSHWQLPLPLQ